MNRRGRAERRFRWLARGAAALSAGIVLLLIGSLIVRGLGGLEPALFGGADSVDAGRAGIGGALVGSVLTIGVTLVLALPLGVAVALYLEEFALRSRWAGALELLIANLAAVPSIVWGLLGLAVFLGGFGLPRSAPLVAGLTLALMTMPTVAITAGQAFRAVPASLREAARGVGASPVQVALHHVLPAAAPGVVTGALLGAARALGETAPLLLIGMRAFIPAAPHGLLEPAAVLPVQIFLWSDQVGHGFVEKTAAAILVLLALTLALTAAGVLLRDRLERRR